MIHSIIHPIVDLNTNTFRVSITDTDAEKHKSCSKRASTEAVFQNFIVGLKGIMKIVACKSTLKRHRKCFWVYANDYRLACDSIPYMHTWPVFTGIPM